MNYSYQQRGALREVVLQGQLDTSVPRSFESELLGFIASGERQLVFDFAQVDYLTSSGIRILLHVFKTMTAVNGRIVFHSLNPRVKHVFEIAGLTQVFRIYDTPGEALQGLALTGMLPPQALLNADPA
ncbi:MAG: STAS domain-containing protein [Acidobacteria bacterium]|nr:STAS domain-containing protein [Acidobacteriota bacterium]MBI3424567.1 STAS domain-containing protein [Acidobacteriota bacterium]